MGSPEWYFCLLALVCFLLNIPHCTKDRCQIKRIVSYIIYLALAHEGRHANELLLFDVWTNVQITKCLFEWMDGWLFGGFTHVRRVSSNQSFFQILVWCWSIYQPPPTHWSYIKQASNHFESNMDMINWVFEYSSILINISNEFAYTQKNLFNFAIASKFEM